MASRIPEAWYEELRSRIEIVDVVSEYVALKQKGTNFWGLCPFHAEKTPSFKVDTREQMFYCFGCHKGGTVIHFTMELERLEFMDAVRMLAERARLPIPRLAELEQPYDKSDREKIYEANIEAARFYHDRLWKPEGADVLTYFYQRGLNDNDIRKFGLGASSKRNELTDYLLIKNFTFDTLKLAGLSNEKDGRRYDIFRNRAIFPIINPQNRVLGFGGRALDDAQPKYLNTAETPVFNKRQGMYALNMAKKERGLDRVIIVEGYMDTVALRRRGINGVVATLGTALTDEQARLIKRYAPKVYLCYDGDAAGQTAALRGLSVLEKSNIPAFVIDIPDGLDPDDFIRQRGLEAFQELKPLAPAEYRLLRAAEPLDLSSSEGRSQYAMAACKILADIKNPVELEDYLQKLSVQTGYAREVLLKQVGMTPRSVNAPERRQTYRIKRKAPAPEYSRAEAMLLYLQANGLIDGGIASDGLFITPLYAKIAGLLAAGESHSSILLNLPDDERNDAAAVFVSEANIDPDKTDRAVSECVSKIKRHKLKGRIAEAAHSIKSETDPEKRGELLALSSALAAELSSISI